MRCRKQVEEISPSWHDQATFSSLVPWIHIGCLSPAILFQQLFSCLSRNTIVKLHLTKGNRIIVCHSPWYFSFHQCWNTWACYSPLYHYYFALVQCCRLLMAKTCLMREQKLSNGIWRRQVFLYLFQRCVQENYRDNSLWCLMRLLAQWKFCLVFLLPFSFVGKQWIDIFS